MKDGHLAPHHLEKRISTLFCSNNKIWSVRLKTYCVKAGIRLVSLASLLFDANAHLESTKVGQIYLQCEFQAQKKR